MTLAQPIAPTSRRPLRVWPGVAAALLGVAVLLLWPVVAPSRGAMSILGIMGGALLIVIWWLFFSRAPWVERLGALVVIAIAAAATRPFVHGSMANAGQGVLFYMIGIPVLCFGLVVWAVATRRLARGPRRAWLLPVIALSCLTVASLRVDGASWTEGLEFSLRWMPTVEDRLLAAADKRQAPDAGPTAPLDAPVAAGHEPAWPGFRGPRRDGVVLGSRIETDWSKSPPVELWRRPVGPAWSSFAIDGDRFYTQEQLGEQELVSCYDLRTGEPIWRHGDWARFWEAAGGAGPRATPTVHGGRVYTVGATGILNALDAGDGSLVWSRNVATDAEKKVPEWGFAGSPLVLGDTLVVAAAGKPISYDLATGEVRWVGPKGGGYSSPQLATIDGVEQILVANGLGAVSVEPAQGKELWKYEWSGDGIVQPAVMDDGSVLIGGMGSSMGSGEPGLRRVVAKRTSGQWSPERGGSGWTVDERWTTTALKPFFNDFVLHHGHAYGFDGAFLACVDLADGQRKWKGGRFGDGQLLLLADQDLLLVLSEKGELALVEAKPEQFVERARVAAIHGKTWNHPAMVGSVVLVRNSEEMAAFRLATAP